jgi:aspartyl-tRNA(Asn)/glutamyl-tRNA(Gln) amidotransferase subunit C
MSKILTNEEVNYIAKLSRIKLSNEETGNFTEQLNSILGYMDKLNELDTKDVEPTSHSFKLVNVYRKDKAENSYDKNELLANAPEPEDGFFKVPKILE